MNTYVATDLARQFGIPVDDLVHAVRNHELPGRSAGALLVFDEDHMSHVLKWIRARSTAT